MRIVCCRLMSYLQVLHKKKLWVFARGRSFKTPVSKIFKFAWTAERAFALVRWHVQRDLHILRAFRSSFSFPSSFYRNYAIIGLVAARPGMRLPDCSGVRNRTVLLQVVTLRGRPVLADRRRRRLRDLRIRSLSKNLNLAPVHRSLRK